MSKPVIPGLANLPGMNAMNETLDFVKNLWGGVAKPSLGLPGMVMPTLSVEEIEKQIKDLKAVEAWLNVNTSMVRSTIQALEVQAGTITTLQSMGQALSNVAAKAPSSDNSRAAARAAIQEEFRSKPAAKKAAAKKAAPAAKGAKAASASAGEAQVPNPALWWNMLQDQFKQAVSSAMSQDAMGAATSAMGNMLRQPVVKDAMKEVVKDAVKGAVKGAAKTAVKTVAKKAAGVTRKKK